MPLEMRDTCGLIYGFVGNSMMKTVFDQANLFEGGDDAGFAERIARHPLAYQPGTTWDYNHSTDILVRVVEVVSGQSLSQFEKQRLLDPLGMSDTSFYVTDAVAHARTLAFMTSDHLGTAIATTPLYLPGPGPGTGFGLGFAVRRAAGEAAYPAEVGSYFWGGAGGTQFWVDAKNDLFIVRMMQSAKQRVYYRMVMHDMGHAVIVE